MEAAPHVDFVHVEDGRTLMQLTEDLLPDIIFLDINMPFFNGWQCLKQLRSTTFAKDIPIFMYSTSSHKRDQQLASDLGATGFITKPSDVTLLQEILKDVTRKLAVQNRASKYFLPCRGIMYGV